MFSTKSSRIKHIYEYICLDKFSTEEDEQYFLGMQGKITK